MTGGPSSCMASLSLAVPAKAFMALFIRVISQLEIFNQLWFLPLMLESLMNSSVQEYAAEHSGTKSTLPFLTFLVLFETPTFQHEYCDVRHRHMSCSDTRDNEEYSRHIVSNGSLRVPCSPAELKVLSGFICCLIKKKKSHRSCPRQ